MFVSSLVLFTILNLVPCLANGFELKQATRSSIVRRRTTPAGLKRSAPSGSPPTSGGLYDFDAEDDGNVYPYPDSDVIISTQFTAGACTLSQALSVCSTRSATNSATYFNLFYYPSNDQYECRQLSGFSHSTSEFTADADVAQSYLYVAGA